MSETEKPKVPENFVVENHYQKYLKLVGLTEQQMGAIQRVETRRAFFGAWGQLLILLREGLPDDEDLGVSYLRTMLDEVDEFWATEVKSHGINMLRQALEQGKEPRRDG